MADGVAITAGSGTTILTDDTGAGGHAQVVKLAIATDGSGTLIPSDGTDGLLVNLGANNDVTVAGVATAANQTTIIGHVDGIETVLGTIDADTSRLAGTVAGTGSRHWRRPQHWLRCSVKAVGHTIIPSPL